MIAPLFAHVELTFEALKDGLGLLRQVSISCSVTCWPLSMSATFVSLELVISGRGFRPVGKYHS